MRCRVRCGEVRGAVSSSKMTESDDDVDGDNMEERENFVR